jgi:hypothetical protein
MASPSVNTGARVDPDLLERARRTAFWTPGLTLRALLEEGLRRECEKLERRSNEGQPFPPCRGPLRYGRKPSG